jgi:uncharacterized protein (TIGR02270 family)
MTRFSTDPVPQAVVVPNVLSQHVEDAAVLHTARTGLTSAPHVRVRHLRRFDDRLAAHLDGLLVAREHGWPICDAALEKPTPGAVFVAAVAAIEYRSGERLDRLYALVQSVPEAQRGLISAFGWVRQDQLRGLVAGLLSSQNSFLRLMGIAACAVHRVEPGKARDMALDDASGALRARALRASGELGRRDLLPACEKFLDADDVDCRFWAASSAVLLGARGIALESLKAIGDSPGRHHWRAFRLALQAMESEMASAWLLQLAQKPENLRELIQGSGIAGDSIHVPLLISHMSELTTARLAGEAFSVITGLDLAYLDLDRKPPEEPIAGPNDNPSDPNVAMDPDDGLPWPDPERIGRWWQSNGSRFQPGTRYFMGALPTREHCLRILKEGFQRQRILAAHYLCLLTPGTPLFEWRAPAQRQQRLLATME